VQDDIPLPRSLFPRGEHDATGDDDGIGRHYFILLCHLSLSASRSGDDA
jgi:hypothetical protein